jgi:FMN-dependent NADH-azoreductase
LTREVNALRRAIIPYGAVSPYANPPHRNAGNTFDMNLLHVDSGILGGISVTRQLSAALVARQRRLHPKVKITYRDLAQNPIPHLTGPYLAALTGTPAMHGPELAHDLAIGTAVLEEFLAADLVVIGAPMYNFTIPTQLKAWFDRLAVAGKTFRYTESGAVGLLGGKRVLIASSRGGFYGVDSPLHAVDHQETYLKAILGFFGITQVQFVRAEGVAISPQFRETALRTALDQIGQMEATAALAEVD